MMGALERGIDNDNVHSNELVAQHSIIFHTGARSLHARPSGPGSSPAGFLQNVACAPELRRSDGSGAAAANDDDEHDDRRLAASPPSGTRPDWSKRASRLAGAKHSALAAWKHASRTGNGPAINLALARRAPIEF